MSLPVRSYTICFTYSLIASHVIDVTLVATKI